MNIIVEYWRELCTNPQCKSDECEYWSYPYYDESPCEFYKESAEVKTESSTKIKILFYPCKYRKPVRTIRARDTKSFDYAEGDCLRLGGEIIDCNCMEYLKIGNKIEIDRRIHK